MPVVLNKRLHGVPENAVYIGRPSKWGNPFHVSSHSNRERRQYTREEAVQLYELYLTNNEELMASLHELKGKDLVCWCAPASCHGDILLKYAND